jgi:hypothetical protein
MEVFIPPYRYIVYSDLTGTLLFQNNLLEVKNN